MEVGVTSLQACCNDAVMAYCFGAANIVATTSLPMMGMLQPGSCWKLNVIAFLK
jgi:hypothetical protein